MSPHRPSRRAVLRAAVTGGALAAGAGLVTTGAELADADVGSSDTSYAAFADGAVARLGEHSCVWSGPADTGRVALTFDDGPHPVLTPRILEILRAHNVSATFNMMGLNAAAFPSLVREVVAAGHEVGNHTYHHLPLGQLSVATTQSELRTAQRTIEDITQRRVTLWRPPHGQLSGALLRAAAELQLTTVLWSVDRLVPGTGTAEQVQHAMAAAIRAGDIVCLHDGLGHAGRHPHSAMARSLLRRRDVEVAALPALLTQLADGGLHVGTVSELLRRPTRPVVPAQRDRRSSRKL